MEGLSDRDQAVLRSIMDPTATLGDLTDDSDHFPEDNAPLSEGDRLSAELCARGAALAEGGRLGDALALMAEGVAAAPARPDAYSDRAQVLRLMMRDTEALSDIERALSLTAGSRCRARALALCQRALLRRKAGAEADARADFVEAAELGSAFAKKQGIIRGYQCKSGEALSDIERALSLTAGSRCRARALALCQRALLRRKAGAEADARADFVEAAEMGSAFAKKQVVELNPYAALCNQMLSQVLRGDKEIKL